MIFVDNTWPFLIQVKLEKENFSREEATYIANSILKAVETSETYEWISGQLKNE